MSTLSEPIGRRIQSAIYRAGALGKAPLVPVDPDRLAKAAEKTMSRRAWAYVAGSAGRWRTTSANRAALDAWQIVPRMLRDVGRRDTSVELFGRRLDTPFLLAPIGVLEMAHRSGDLAVADAASELNVPMVISTQASHPMETIAARLGDAPRWYQLYWSRDHELAASFVNRAEQIGCDAIVVTLDTHQLGWRPADLDLGFLPFARAQGIAQYNSDPVFRELVQQRLRQGNQQAKPKPTVGAIRTLIAMSRAYPGSPLTNLRSPLPRASVETFLEVFSNPSLSWNDLPVLREMTNLPIVLKGIQHPADAERAVDAGVDAIVVSNHGGRQVDGAIGSADALAEIAPRVGDRIDVLFDSGIRSGADAFKAIALGARAVLVGRPYVYGLSLAGAEGVVATMNHLQAEFDLTMGLTGCATLDGVTAELLHHPASGAW